MKTRLFLLLGIFTMFISCDKNKVYSKLDTDFENNRWSSDQEKIFDFSIEDDSKTYTLNLKFSHIYDYQYESIPLLIKITSPDEKEEQIPFDLKIKDATGKQLAECSGDVCDLLVPLKENAKFLKGAYKISITNQHKGPYLPNVLGIGLEVITVK
ncbi:hypothetical protein LZZ90_11860 [Flavobacterium sp. SM15]|uniref:hypothetical protein n=1 Tax=Flavobacterium sp. SM15 TaxID=2908005 RepID=UPI001EDAC182|nr:hypothetical protein [Flavobacterium sp. SM15]MCG2612202.1 hypothetical protein [Flavobacterium sp. SM15]